MKKSLEAIYDEMKSLYGKGFGAYLNAFSVGTNILSDPGYDSATKEEIFSIVKESMEKIEDYYSSLPEDVIGQPHFEEIRDIREMIPELKENVEYVLDNYMDSDASEKIATSAAESHRISTDISQISSGWRHKINEIGKQIGNGKDIWHYK